MLQKHGIRLTKPLLPVKFEEQLNYKLEEKAQLREKQKSAETACHEAEQKLQILMQYLDGFVTTPSRQTTITVHHQNQQM